MSSTLVSATLIAMIYLSSAAQAAEEPDLIFKRSTVFKWVSPNDKLANYGLDDPEVEGVACHFTAPERGGFKGWIGLAEEVSDISLACRQIAPVRFKVKFEQGKRCTRSAALYSSKRCRLFAAATSSAMFWCTWSIRTASSRARQRTPLRLCPSCLGATTTRFSDAVISWSRRNF